MIAKQSLEIEYFPSEKKVQLCERSGKDGKGARTTASDATKAEGGEGADNEQVEQRW